MGYNGGKLQWISCSFLQNNQLELESILELAPFSQIYVFMQESGQISVTDYVPITSTEWYAITLDYFGNVKN